MAKRTIKITRLIEMVNKLNEESEGAACVAIRRGANSFLSTILMECDCYAGFGYLEADKVPAKELPGMIRGDTSTSHQFPDDTRIFYYVHRKLQG